MTISFIGAGKVATSLGLYFAKNNLNILGFYSRSFDSAKNASQLTGSKAFKNLKQALEADLIFITVNDDSINKVANDISKLKTIYLNKIFVHTSGALSSLELSLLQSETSCTASLHPIQAFTDIKGSVLQLQQTVFSLEGDPQSVKTLGSVLDQCGNQYFILSKEQKPLYHASACVLSNYLVTLLGYGFSMLDHMGLPSELALKSFFPLIESTLDNIKAHGPEDALTGPISRGDIQTVHQHLEAFKKNQFYHTALYKQLGLHTLDLAKKSKLQNKDIAFELSELLKEDHNEK